MDGKTLKRGYIDFPCNSAVDVTGSANLIRFLNYHILVDYGLKQTNKDDDDYKDNSKRPKNIKPKKLDAIVLTHCHIDHCGRIPMLYRDGADCPLYVTKGCKKLLTLMLQDCCKIFNSDYERYGRRPLYSQDDIDNTLQHIVECDFDKSIQINDNISFVFSNAQHIVRAAQIVFTLNDGIKDKHVGFTGDWSDYRDTYYLDNRSVIQKVDILVGECTYGDKTRLDRNKDRKVDINKLDTAIKYAYSHKGKVIIPTFSLHRLQLMLAVLYGMYKDNKKIRILVDTPLGKNISEIWDSLIDKDDELWNEIKAWDNVHWITDFKDSMHFSALDEPMVVLGSGGFLKGGRATYWVKEHLGNKKNYIVFCGYSSEESPAGQIKSGKLKQIKIDGQTISNKANVITLNSFSSHADHRHLLEYYTEIQYNKICLVHGEQEGKNRFAEELRQELSKKDRSSRVVAVNNDTKVYI